MADEMEYSENLHVKMGAASQANQIQWKAISLTHVEYPKGDIIGFVLAVLSLTPIGILVGFATLILFRRDLHTISYFIGLLLNEIVNFILKHLIKEYRPLRERETVFSEYGMPSSHAQFMWFYAVYLSFFLIIRMHRNYHLIDELWKYAIGSIVYGLACIVGFSRIYLGYHSFSQVAVGAVIGLILGTLWFSTVHLVLTPFFPILASCSLGEFLMLRDSTLIPNVMWFEYTCSRSESRSRQRKITSRKSQ